MAANARKKLCFVVGPIGDDESDDRIHADWLLEEIILPVFDDFPDFEVKRADKISNPGRIDAQVITALLDAELVIADLTTLNPNAFYEIGIRHTINRPIIHMHLEGQRIPFDIASFRSIKFSRKWPKDLKAARDALKGFIVEATDEDHEVDNPVTFARGKIEFQKTATPKERIVEEQLSDISSRLRRIEQAGSPKSLRLVRGAGRSMTYNELRNVLMNTQGIGTLRIDILPGEVQGVASFESDVQQMIDAYLPSRSIEGSPSHYVVRTTLSEDTLMGVKALIDDGNFDVRLTLD